MKLLYGSAPMLSVKLKSQLTRFLGCVLVGIGLMGLEPSVLAEEALFFGNSFTFGGADKAVAPFGGVPKIVEAIAASKNKVLSSRMVTAGGKTFSWHLQQEKTGEELKSKSWDWVVLQGNSTEPTHIGKVDEFLKGGEALEKRVAELSPKAGVILYETWARPKDSPLVTGTSSAKSFADVAEMSAEVHKAYGDLLARLKVVDPKRRILLAPVGHAFARCREKYPDIQLDWSDHHHASTEGSYLAALVIYGTMFHDSPKGATREFFEVHLDSSVASRLQEVADEILFKKKS